MKKKSAIPLKTSVQLKQVCHNAFYALGAQIWVINFQDKTGGLHNADPTFKKRSWHTTKIMNYSIGMKIRGMGTGI